MKIEQEILAKMEQIEATRINIGIYEASLSFMDICGYFSQLSTSDVQNCLEQLVLKKEILHFGNGYRTRIAETVRLLFFLRQRLWYHEKIQDSPLLLEDIRVEFRQRRRPKRQQYQLKNIIPSEIHPSIQQGFLQALPFSTCSGFQKRGIIEIIQANIENNCNHKNFLIAGDTGAGKTEAFLFPILLSILQEPTHIQKQIGVRAVLIYPRIRLALNQLNRIIRLCTDINTNTGRKLTIGIQNGSIPQDASEIKNHQIRFIDSCLQKDCIGKYYVVLEDKYLVNTGTPRLKCSDCNHIIDNVTVTKSALRHTAPDFLVITDVSLNQWLSNPDYTHLFGLWGSEEYLPPKFLVLDEVHLYERLKGAHISKLIRRFKARVALTYKHRPDLEEVIPMLIGISATLNDEEAFLRKLIHLQHDDRTEKMVIIKPNEDELELMEGRERYLFLLPKKDSPTSNNPEYRVNDQTAAIQIMMALMHNLKTDSSWKGLTFFDSINDLIQFSRNYDPTYGEGTAQVEKSANYNELWRIRTDKTRPSQVKFSKISKGCKICSQHRTKDLDQCPHFQIGDYWVFAHMGWNRSLKVSPPIFAGQRKNLSNDDMILSSPSLEVGYDDADVQMVYQHKAPPSIASFIQRRGRAGRDPNDSPVISTLLWPYRNNDLFYFYYPETLYNPQFDDIPLNPSNVNVQRSQAIQAFFDIIACYKRAYPNAQLNNYTSIGGTYIQPNHSKSKQCNGAYGPAEVLTFSDSRKDVWLSNSHPSFQRKDNTFLVKGSWGLFKDCFSEPLRREWDFICKKIPDINQFLVQYQIMEANFVTHTFNPLRQYKGMLPSLVQHFGRKKYHLKTYNWIESYLQVDWMLQGSWNDSSILIDISKDMTKEEKDNIDIQKQYPLDFGLQEFLPGNVSHRLRIEGTTYWNPVPKDRESTFDFSTEQLEKMTIFDLGQGSDSLLAIPNFLSELSPKLECIDIQELPVRLFSHNDQIPKPWYFVPVTSSEGYCIQNETPLDDWKEISPRSSCIAQTVIIPFIAQDGGQSRKNIGAPMDVLFASAEGFLYPGQAMFGYYQVTYAYQANLNLLGVKENQTLERYFYLPQKSPSPIFLAQKIETQGICFTINPDIVNATHEKIQNVERVRLLLRGKLLQYLMLSTEKEYSGFYTDIKEYTCIVQEFLCLEIIPKEGFRYLDSHDINTIIQFYASRYCTVEDRVQEYKFRTFLLENEPFLENISKAFKIAFQNTLTFSKFIQSVLYHSLASCLKILLSRLGGLTPSELLAFADMSIFDMVDETDLPRIIILEKEAGGTGGLLQAFDRLDSIQDETSLWHSLQETLGRCPIADGERLVTAVLKKATVQQLQQVQSNISLDNVRQLLVTLQLDRTENSLIHYLTRFLAKTTFITHQEKIYPAQIRQELVQLKDKMEQHYSFPISDEILLHYAANPKYITTKRPAIKRLSELLENPKQLYLQLKAIQPNQCKDGCPICVGTSSDIAPRTIADLFNSREVLTFLREELNSKLPNGNLDKIEPMLQRGAVLVDQNPPLSGDTFRKSGIQSFTHLDEDGQIQSVTSVVVDEDAFQSSTDWKHGSIENYPYELRDGTPVRSRAEFILGTQLLDENIPFIYEPELSLFDEEIGEFCIKRPDFVVHFNRQKIYIEYWGMNTPNYLEQRQEKERLYAMNPDIKLLSLEMDAVENKKFLIQLKQQFDP